MNVYACPNCGEPRSERFHSEMLRDKATQVRGCDECLAEWTVEYGEPIITDVRRFD